MNYTAYALTLCTFALHAAAQQAQTNFVKTPWSDTTQTVAWSEFDTSKPEMHIRSERFWIAAYKQKCPVEGYEFFRVEAEQHLDKGDKMWQYTIDGAIIACTPEDKVALFDTLHDSKATPETLREILRKPKKRYRELTATARLQDLQKYKPKERLDDFEPRVVAAKELLIAHLIQQQEKE